MNVVSGEHHTTHLQSHMATAAPPPNTKKTPNQTSLQAHIFKAITQGINMKKRTLQKTFHRPLQALLAGCLVSAPYSAIAAKFSNMKEFERCAQKTDADKCLLELDDYLLRHPAESFEAGKIVRRTYNAEDATPAFAVAAKRPPSGFCENSDVIRSISAGLKVSYSDDRAKHARFLMADVCYKQLSDAMQKVLDEDGGNQDLKENLCPIFAASKVVAPHCATMN